MSVGDYVGRLLVDMMGVLWWIFRRLLVIVFSVPWWICWASVGGYVKGLFVDMLAIR